MSSVVEKARIMRGCTAIRVAVNIRLRVRGSCCRWFWLARIISGTSQQDRTSRGEDVWSVPAHRLRFL